MTVSSATARDDYNGNGVTTTFPVTFRFLENSHLRVLRTVIATNVTTVLTLDSLGADGYSVSGANQPNGGAVTVVTPPAGPTPGPAERLSILRNVPLTQEIDYIANDPFPAESHERGLDKLTMIVQQQTEVTDRAVVLPAQTTGVSNELPGPVALNLLRWNAAETALENAVPPAIATVADGAVVDATVSPIAAIQGTKLAFLQDGAGAATVTMQDKARERISVKDFGAVGDGVADDTAAIQAAIDSISPNQSFRGSIIYLPRGQYRITAPITLTSYAVDNAINIGIEGDGWLSTWIDASGLGAGEDAIFVPGDQQVTIRGFFLKGGPAMRDGIHFGDSGSDAVSVFDIADVRVQQCGRDGFHHYNSYMGTMNRCYALANGRDGFRGDGFHTSLTHQTCYALDNVEAGFNYNGMVYSTFVGCGSDLGQFGYVLANAHGVVFSGCGSEGNNQDGWLIFADTGTVPLTNPLFVQECYDVRAVTLIGCSGYANNQLNAGYAGLARVVANGVHSGPGSFNDGSPHTVDVVIQGCDASNNPSGTRALVTSVSAGGAVYVTESNNFFPGGRTIGTGTVLRNESLIGKSCVLTLGANQSIPTSVDTAINWSTATDDIGGCWVIGSPNLITIPAALDGLKIVIKFQAAFAADNTGARLAMVLKNGSYIVPMPRAGWSEADFYNAVSMSASPPVRVLAGDQFQLVVQQNTVGALNFSALISYLSIEVVG